MTKHIILFFAALCSLHNHANAAPSDSDTVRYESFSNGIEMLRPMQPSYLDGVVSPDTQKRQLVCQPVRRGIGVPRHAARL